MHCVHTEFVAKVEPQCIATFRCKLFPPLMELIQEYPYYFKLNKLEWLFLTNIFEWIIQLRRKSGILQIREICWWRTPTKAESGIQQRWKICWWRTPTKAERRTDVGGVKTLTLADRHILITLRHRQCLHWRSDNFLHLMPLLIIRVCIIILFFIF